jgi:hypothetical protein
MTRTHQAVAAFGTCILLAAGANAQSKKSSGGDASQKELYNYVLTMDKIQKMANATRDLEALAKQHPDLKDTGSANSLNESVAKIEKYPEAVAAIKKNGLTTREYLVGFMTLLQATMAVGFKKSGTYKDYPPTMLQLVSKQNLDFVEQHWNEIRKLMKMDSDDK